MTGAAQEKSFIERLRSVEIICMGASAGGGEAFQVLLPALGGKLPVPVVIVQHVAANSPGLISRILGTYAKMPVIEVEDKEPVRPGKIYLAPPDYHLMVDNDGSFSLSVDEPVCYSRPSIDVLFDSVAATYGSRALAILLSGANADGAAGLKRVKDAGGWTWVQDPASAPASFMPKSALELKAEDLCLTVEEMASMLERWDSE